MRKVMFIALMAATVLPGTSAMAQTGELHRDRRDIREEQRDVREAQRHGDRRDVREERRDVREARREYREDWRDYRKQNRDVYRRGNWRSSYRYRAFHPGTRIERGYWSPRYVIDNPRRYRLPPAGGNLRWVRHYDDVLLINIRTGRVVEVHRGFFW